MADSGLTPAVAAGISPVVGGPERPAIDLSGARSRKLSERAIGVVLFVCGALSIATTVGIVAVLIEQAVEFFLHVSPWDFLVGTQWTALFKNPKFGVLPLVAGTLWISAIAMVIALPLGLMSAIYLSEYAPGRVRDVLKPALELLAGVPTIVYGFFAVTFIRPEILKPIFPEIGPFSAMSAGIAVGILVLPLVASLAEDALRAVPRALREAAFALGATQLEVATSVVVPAAFSGVVASFILAASRAIGETMIVAQAASSKPQLSANPLDPMQAMTGFIVQVFSGDVTTGSLPYLSLFAVGLLLLLMTLVLNIVSQVVVARFREAYE